MEPMPQSLDDGLSDRTEQSWSPYQLAGLADRVRNNYYEEQMRLIERRNGKVSNGKH